MDKKTFMLCDSIKEEEFRKMDLSNYIGEDKKDGERIIVCKEGLQVWIFNRRGREKGFIYPEIVKDLEKLQEDFIIDGEVITKDGLFNSLQHRSNLGRNKVSEGVRNYPIEFCVFDIISFNKMDLRNKPLVERKKYLEFLRGLEAVKILNWFEDEDIRVLWEFIKEHNKEGIILKLKNSVYEARRSEKWIKCKNFKEEVVKLTKFAVNNAGFRCEDDFDNAVQVAGEESKEVANQITNNGFCYVVIQYLEKTKDNKFRFPSFKGIKC